MKRIIFLSTITATILSATNGDIMIGNGTKSSAMGGIGISVSHGAESALANPALINSVKDGEFITTLTFFIPTVEFSSNAQANAMSVNQGGAYPNSAEMTLATSKTDSPVVPDFVLAQRVNDDFVVGLTVDGTAGLGVDYTGKEKSGAFNMETALRILKVGVPISYTIHNTPVTFGVEPVMQYSTLNINYMTPQGASNNKEAKNFGYGFEAGIALEEGGFALGAVYKSEINAEYEGNIANAMRDFGVKSVTSGDTLNQPAEMGVGVAYTYANNTLALDYKKIAWGQAKGYKDFGWKDQDVIAVGYKYTGDNMTFRAGYNHAETPLQEKNGQAQGQAGYENAAINFFNLSGFPATVEDHYTVGADYKITDNLDLNIAYIYAPEVITTFDTTGMTRGMVMQGEMASGATQQQAQAAAGASANSTATVRHAQDALLVGISYKF